MRRLVLVLIAGIVLATGSFLTGSADTPEQALNRALGEIHQKHKLPAVAALVQLNGRVVLETATGVRAFGRSETVTVNDLWHIGSDTKAFTSTLILRLSERGVLRLEDTLAQSLPAVSARMHPGYREVTIAQLLSHTGGLPPLTEDKELQPFLDAIKVSNDVRAQRASIAATYLSQPPASKPGEFVYSNLGYIIAGAIAEVKTGKPWEDLIRQDIFAPLGITNAGFGVPGAPGRADQPQGHSETPRGLIALDPGNPDGDNPLALGPAGTIHISLRDWMKFAQDQLDGVNGKGKLLSSGSYRRLHTPVAGPYALGWGAKLDDAGHPLLITHSGSNGFWLADIRIMPRKNLITLFVTNAGNEAANLAARDFFQTVREQYKPFE